jgi:hypothetical protein
METRKNRGLKREAELILLYYVPHEPLSRWIPPWAPKQKQSSLAPGFFLVSCIRPKPNNAVTSRKVAGSSLSQKRGFGMVDTPGFRSPSREKVSHAGEITMKRHWETDELVEHWTLLPRETELLTNKTGATRLGFALSFR